MFEQYRGQLIEAAKRDRPHEMCGVIYDGRFIELTNVHPEPECNFLFGQEDNIRAMTDPKVEAIVHSHLSCDIDCGPCPSKFDLQQQLATGKPWVIIAFDQRGGTWHQFDWGAHTVDQPILEQPFIYGVNDCYQLVRKWFWQNRKIMFPAVPSDWGWWEDEDLYASLFPQMGFSRFTPKTPADLLPGDGFLYPLQSERYNHVGLYIGDHTVIDHSLGNLSQKWVIGPWFRRATVWLRYTGDGNPPLRIAC